VTGPTRRTVVAGGAMALLAPAMPQSFAQTATLAQTSEQTSHGLSVFQDLAYPADFKHFAYADPTAPKGGTFGQEVTRGYGNQSFDTFNTLHIWVLKGEGAGGIQDTFDTLMVRALDEPDAMYGLIAKSVSWSQDGLTYRFHLRPEARFHDGTRLTARDCAFSILTMKAKGHPRISQELRQVEAAEAEGDDVLVVRFAPGRARNLPLAVADIPIFSEAFWKGRDFEVSSLEPVLGSGPYKVGRFEQGRYIELDRVADYWAKDLPVNLGQHNFAKLRYDYFRDDETGFQAFTSGLFNFREEHTSRLWATRYTFPALKDGRVKREEVPDETPAGAQGWYFNTRRPQFKDPRIREAIALAFDFDWTNTNLMYGSYVRNQSFFEGSDHEADGLPGTDELALLEPFRASLPPDVFGKAFSLPKSDGSGQDRTLLRRAGELLTQAGCRRSGPNLLAPDGKPFAIEFLDYSERLQPHTQPFIKNLKLLGIDAKARIVDDAQYQRRTNQFDFDVTSRRYTFPQTPGEGLRNIFGAKAAATVGSFNLAGITDPVVDALIDAIVAAETRAKLVAACKALDRVLRAGRYWVPMWHKASHWLVYWDEFGRPAVKPRYERGAPRMWWYDEAKAKRIGRG
jgi:microcin C transport system substrate-binding protein